MMNNPFQEIEQGAVLFDLMVANTPYTLRRRMEQNAVLNRAKQIVRDNPEIEVSLLECIEAALSQSVAPGYQHPADLLVTAYLYALSESLNPQVRDMVEAIVQANRPEFDATTAYAHYLRANQSVIAPLQSQKEGESHNGLEVSDRSKGSLTKTGKISA